MGKEGEAGGRRREGREREPRARTSSVLTEGKEQGEQQQRSPPTSQPTTLHCEGRTLKKLAHFEGGAGTAAAAVPSSFSLLSNTLSPSPPSLPLLLSNFLQPPAGKSDPASLLHLLTHHALSRSGDTPSRTAGGSAQSSSR